MSIHFKEIDFGFEYGCAKITRLCSDDTKGWVVLDIHTPKKLYDHGIQVYVTKTGKVRIHDSRGEWTPPKGTP